MSLSPFAVPIDNDQGRYDRHDDERRPGIEDGIYDRGQDKACDQAHGFIPPDEFSYRRAIGIIEIDEDPARGIGQKVVIPEIS